MKTRIALVPATLLSVLLTACGGGSGGSGTPTAAAPSIATQPSGQKVVVGQPATFTVVAGGSAPLAYQWQKGGTAISGATASSYTTPPTVQSDDGSTFLVVVSNAAGSMTSTGAKLS